MGKRIISRARGKGGPAYASPGHRFPGAISYPQQEKTVKVIDIIHDPSRDAPLTKVITEKGAKLMIATEGTKVGDVIEIGGTTANQGNILRLSAMPKGSYVFGKEITPGSGPKLCCSAGTVAVVISHEPNKVILQMPSKAFKTFNPNCLATLGVPAGGGRGDKLFIKAGQAFYLNWARNKLWPRSSANKMNPVDHPFGGKTKPGTPKTKSTWSPPGSKVGSIGARRTGRSRK